VAQGWTPAGTALSDGPSAAKVAEVKAYDTGDAVGYDRVYTYDGAQRLTNGDRSPIVLRDDGKPGLLGAPAMVAACPAEVRDRTAFEVLRGAEDVMCADPAPDDVHLTDLDLGSEFPGSPPVRGERHLHDVAGPLHAFHPETGPERTTRFQILDKPGNRSTKPLLLGSAERSPVLVESRKPLVGRHLTE
jgi:hypothetical protein